MVLMESITTGACGGFTISVNSGIVFEQFIEIVGSSVGIDIRISDIEIIYGHQNLTPSRLIRFMPFPIPNGQAMKTMFSIVMPIPNMVHLYVNVSRVGLDINLNSEPFGQLEDRTQVIVSDSELVASSVHDDEEMVANNEYMDFKQKHMMSLKSLTLMVRDVRDIVGPLILLQIWAWERFPTIAPQLTHANDHLLLGRELGSPYAILF
uniref:Uncharacterized protein n=1 Tax=Cucumis melo TaxID=3656 RepID=A0A9I9E759_CUCME